MTDKLQNVRDTKHIQEESLVNFMAAIGYEPVYNFFTITGFYQPAFAKTGKARISVNKAIEMHNYDADEAFQTFLSDAIGSNSLREYLRKSDLNLDEITNLFAGTCKIVQHINGNYSRKKGLVINKHQVKFMTKYDERRYGFDK